MSISCPPEAPASADPELSRLAKATIKSSGASVNAPSMRGVVNRRPRLNSVSTPFGGLGWDWAATDRKAISDLFVFLNRRRALTEPPEREDMSYVVDSVLKISEELVQTRQRLKERSGAQRAVLALEDACVEFLNRVDGNAPWGYNPAFVAALGQLRGQFSIFLRELAREYKININAALRLRALLWPTFPRHSFQPFSPAGTDELD